MNTKTTLSLVLGLSCLTLTAPVFSMDDSCMSQVSMYFTTEGFVNSQTSLVSIGLSASVPANQVDALTETIKTKLAAISKEKSWRLINLTRNESDSGLMTITGQAVARLNNNAINTVQAQLKTLNKPGEKYTIDNIDYQADLQTINQAKAQLRTNLYQQMLIGQKELNAALPTSHSPFQLYKVNFNDATLPAPVAYIASNMHAKQRNNSSQASSLSGKMKMSASVTYATPMPHCSTDKNA